MRRVIRKLRRNIREVGWRRTLDRGVRRLRGGYVHERMITLLKELDEIAPAGGRSGVRVEDLEDRHLPLLRALNARRNSPETDRYFDESLAKGHRGFVALKGEEAVGYYWWTDATIDPDETDQWMLGSDFRLGEGDVYGSSLYLIDDHRGGGAAGDVLFAIETSLRDRGYRRLWGSVDEDNRPARWLYSVRGYDAVWEVDYRHFLTLRSARKLPLSDSGD